MEKKSILYLPLDIPKLGLDREKILEYFFERRTIHQQWAWVEFKKMEQDVDPDLLKICPGLSEILRLFPFKDYLNELHVDFRQQLVEIWPHHDPVTSTFGSAELGPTAYKNMTVRDKVETFYLLPQSTNPDVFHYDKRPLSEHNIVWPRLPEDSDWFAINNHVGFHGSTLNRTSPDDPSLEEELKSIIKQDSTSEAKRSYKIPSDMKLIMFFSGPLNVEKHLELIDRSVKKYEEYVIYN